MSFRRKPLFSLLAICSMIAACEPMKDRDSRCVYSPAEIAQLEARGSNNDRAALRELELCYDFRADSAARERIHALRLNLQEPEALNEEAMKLLLQSKRETRSVEKMRLLEKALETAKISKSTDLRGSTDRDLVITSITKEISRLRTAEK